MPTHPCVYMYPDHFLQAIFSVEMLYACCMHVNLYVTCMQHAWKTAQIHACYMHVGYKCNLHVTCAKVNNAGLPELCM